MVEYFPSGKLEVFGAIAIAIGLCQGFFYPNAQPISKIKCKNTCVIMKL